MLTHPDPIIQQLFDYLGEQRDIAMLKAVNAAQALKLVEAENIRLKAELDALKPRVAQPTIEDPLGQRVVQ